MNQNLQSSYKIHILQLHINHIAINMRQSPGNYKYQRVHHLPELHPIEPGNISTEHK